MKSLIKIMACSVTLFFLSSANASTPFLSIVPNATSTTVHSNSSTFMNWTITNNFNTTISNVTIDPNYLTTGQPNSTITSNTCANLSALSHCTFTTLIQGENQPSSFRVTPRVCGFKGALCAQPLGSNALNVNVDSVPDAYAYITLSGVFGSPESNALISNASLLNPDLSNPIFSKIFSSNPLILKNLQSNTLPGSASLLSINSANLQAGSPLTGFNFSEITRVAVSPDGTRVALVDAPSTGDQASVLKILSGGASPVLLGSLDIPNSSHLCFAVISPDNQTVYVDDVLNARFYIISISDPSHPILQDSTQLPLSPFGLVVNSTGTEVYILGYDGHYSSIIQFDTVDNQYALLTELPDQIALTLTESPDDQELYVAAITTNSVEAISTSNGSLLFTVSVGAEPLGIAASHDGKRVYVANTEDLSVSAIDTATDTVAQTFDVECKASGVSVSPDSSKVFVVCPSQSIVPVINTQTNSIENLSLPDQKTAATELGNFVG